MVNRYEPLQAACWASNSSPGGTGLGGTAGLEGWMGRLKGPVSGLANARLALNVINQLV